MEASLNEAPSSEYHARLERNLALNRREYQERKVVLESWPTELMVILTTRCNLKCVHCSREISNKVLPEEKAWQLTEFFPYAERINWQGGEAFLAPYFKKLLLEGARYPRLDQQVTTAGVLIDKGWAETLANANASIAWSIDGVTKETFETIRHPAKFDRLLESVELMHEAYARLGRKPILDICACVMRANHRELEPFFEFARRYGFGSVTFFPMSSTAYGDNGQNIFAGASPEDAEAVSYLRDSYPRMTKAAEASGITLRWRLPGSTLVELRGAPPVREFSCAKPWHKFVVRTDHDGKVFPECVCLIPGGDVMRDSLKEIWNGPAMREYRRRLRDQTMAGFCNPDCLNDFLVPSIRTYGSTQPDRRA